MADKTAALYALRAGVVVGRDKDGRWLLRDRTLRRAMRLGDGDARLLRLLGQGRGRTFSQLVSTLQADAADVRRRLSGFARLYVLRGDRACLRLELSRESADFTALLLREQEDLSAAADALVVHFPPGRDPPRHSCVATGACCSASFLGPMSTPDRLRVSALRLGARSRVEHGVDALESVLFRGEELWGMRRMAGRCVSLGDDDLCDLHAEHGYAIKPIPCRQFPLRFHRTPWGLHVSLLLACEGYDRARDTAAAWSTRETEVRAFVAEGAHVPASALPFEWSAGLPASVAETRALMQRLQDIVLASEMDDAAAAVLAENSTLERDPRVLLAQIITDFESQVLARAEQLAEGPAVGPERAGPTTSELATSELATSELATSELATSELATSELATSELATSGLATALTGSAPWFNTDKLTGHQANINARIASLETRDEPADVQRLQRFSLGISALSQNLQVAPRGDFHLSTMARRHLLDVVYNDLPAQIALGQLDAGLANLARRLRFIEALACAFCAADSLTAAGQVGTAGLVSAAHTTLALKVAYRSEPDITALAAADSD